MGKRLLYEVSLLVRDLPSSKVGASYELQAHSGTVPSGPLRDTARAMSQKNLELVRSIYADWERGDFSSAEWAHSDIEFAFEDGPEPGRWRGREAMSRRYGDWLRGFEAFRAEPERYLVVDEHRILVLVHNSGRGRTSGLEFDSLTVANFFEIEDGLVTRLVIYWDRDRALADLSLSE